MGRREPRPNIGPGERRKRLLSGAAAGLVAVAALAVLVLVGAARPWRLLLALPFWGAALGLYQHREKT